jgi:hypothetical protein
MKCEVHAVEDRVAVRRELKFAIALGGVLVDGKVPLIQLPALAQAAQWPSCVVHVAEATAD